MLVRTNKVLWFTGLSGAGKTTLGIELSNYYKSNNIKNIILDGDILRNGLNNNLGFSTEDRIENIRRTAEVAKLFMNEGYIVICTLISPEQKMRDIAREIIGENFREVYIKCSLEKCIERDVKGLYKKAIEGEIKNFTGLGSKYEIPENSDIIIDTEYLDLGKSLKMIVDNESKR